MVGTPIANRSRGKLEGLIGFFVNTLAMRNQVDGRASYREMLRRVREVVLGAYAHQEVPFEKLVEEFQPGRAAGHREMFQVMFALQNMPRPVVKLSGLTLTRLDVHNETPKFDLLLILNDGGTQLTGWLEYNANLFEPSTIERMSSHFRNLLQAIVSDPGQRVSDLALFGDDETGGITPSAFTDIDLTQRDFENLLIELNQDQI